MRTFNCQLAFSAHFCRNAGEKTRDYTLPVAEMSYPNPGQRQCNEVHGDTRPYQHRHVRCTLIASVCQPHRHRGVEPDNDGRQGTVGKKQL